MPGLPGRIGRGLLRREPATTLVELRQFSELLAKLLAGVASSYRNDTITRITGRLAGLDSGARLPKAAATRRPRSSS